MVIDQVKVYLARHANTIPRSFSHDFGEMTKCFLQREQIQKGRNWSRKYVEKK